MKKYDYYSEHTGLNNSLSFITMLTKQAQPRSEFEVHAHYNEFEIYHFLEGDLYFAFEGKRFEVMAGTMIIISPGTLHRPIIKTTCRYYRKRVLFNKEIFAGLNTSAIGLSALLRERKIIAIRKEDVSTLQLDTLFNQIEHSLSEGNSYEDFCALISLFSLLIKAEKSSRQNGNDFVFQNNGKADEIVEYIEEHLSESLNYKTISEKFYISEKNLYKLFKKETGFTLSNYINERRIIKAQSILNAGGTANEAAIASGFKDYSVFYRSFLRKVGISPAEYIKSSDIT